MLIDKLMKALGIIKYREFRKHLGIEERLLRVAEDYDLVKLEFNYVNKYFGIKLEEKTVNL